MTFKERLKSLGFDSYDDYLCGKHWQEFRNAYRESGRPMRCAVCSQTPVQLHHHDYSSLGEERFSDIDPLCRQHHSQIHEILKQKNWFVDSTHKVIAELRGTLTPVKQRKKKATKKEKRQAKTARRKAKAAKQQADQQAAMTKLQATMTEQQLAMAKIAVTKISSLLKDGVVHPLIPSNYVPSVFCENLFKFLKLLKRNRSKSLRLQRINQSPTVVPIGKLQRMLCSKCNLHRSLCHFNRNSNYCDACVSPQYIWLKL